MYVQSASPKSLSDLDSVFGWKAPGSGPDLRDMIQEFQGLRVGIAAGSTQSAALLVRNSGGTTNNLALISTLDVIFGAVEFQNTTASGVSWISLRNDVRIHATAGYISVSGGAQTGSQILVFWLDKTGYKAY